MNLINFKKGLGGVMRNAKIKDPVVLKEGQVITVCYGEEQVWDSREEAKEFFLEAMMASEGSEQQRYVNIFTELSLGFIRCIDGE